MWWERNLTQQDRKLRNIEKNDMTGQQITYQDKNDFTGQKITLQDKTDVTGQKIM